jgi:hypothetical protein
MNGNSGNRSATSTFKLSGVINHPSPGPFTMRMRDVGWHPDATLDSNDLREELFPEEAIGRDDKGFLIPFPVPTSQDANGKDVPFLDPTQAGAGDGFNRWILGWSVPDVAEDEPPLTTLVRELATACRHYNASLYRLRRLHYHFYHPDDPLPPQNPHGDPELPPRVGTTIAQLVAEAERDWKEVVIPQIQNLLDNKQTFGGKDIQVIAADMMEVNGYIVSMRVIAEGVGEGAEVGGSSSHVSISSAFSSH